MPSFGPVAGETDAETIKRIMDMTTKFKSEMLWSALISIEALSETRPNDTHETVDSRMLAINRLAAMAHLGGYDSIIWELSRLYSRLRD
jgi:hypothetical protein